MAEQFLDKNGLKTLWAKIKSLVSTEQTFTNSIRVPTLIFADSHWQYDFSGGISSNSAKLILCIGTFYQNSNVFYKSIVLLSNNGPTPNKNPFYVLDYSKDGNGNDASNIAVSYNTTSNILKLDTTWPYGQRFLIYIF